MNENKDLLNDMMIAKAKLEAIDRACRVFTTWWAFVNAGRELDYDPPLKDDDVILHYSGNGAGCMVTAGQINAMSDALNEASIWIKEKR